jgi:hypothetical protein
MNCTLCGSKIESESLKHHIQNHVHDKQYGVKPDVLANALADLTLRVDKLEQLIKVLEIAYSAPAEVKKNKLS